MPLLVDIGHSSHAGQRPRNEDFVGASVPEGSLLTTHGILTVVADGVSGHEGGREAAEYAARGLLTDYFATPETWEPSHALDKVLTAINSWVHAQGQSRREFQGMATTISALMLRGRSYAYAHVGDCRLMRLRQEQLTCLTTDHVWNKPDMNHVLTRAIGLEKHVVIDHGMGALAQGDLYLLCSDGVWDVITQYDMKRILLACQQGSMSAEQAARELTDLSLKEGSKDNVSAIVVRVDALPDTDARDAFTEHTDLPALPSIDTGDVIDGLTVVEILHKNDATQVVRATDEHQRSYVLKALQPNRANDAHERVAFAHEEWIAKRVVARFFAQYIPWEKRSHLYFLTTWHDGHTLEQILERGQHITVPDVIAWGVQLTRALGALHRRNILHRDIKPANLHWGHDGQLRVLDFGVAVSGADGDLAQATPRAGTPSYLAPELLSGTQNAPNIQSDLYAAGVTLYHLLTRKYPYGEIEPFQRPVFGESVSPTRYRPEIPMWLENVLLKAVTKSPSERFETAEEFLLALERAHVNSTPPQRSAPIIQRLPIRFWQIGFVLSLVLNLTLIIAVWMNLRH